MALNFNDFEMHFYLSLSNRQYIRIGVKNMDRRVAVSPIQIEGVCTCGWWCWGSILQEPVQDELFILNSWNCTNRA